MKSPARKGSVPRASTPAAASTSNAAMAAGKPVGAVVAAVRILRHLAESSEPLSSNRIARELSLNPSTCFNILKTLQHEGLTWCDGETKRHRLGLSLLELAGGAMDQLGYKEILHPQLERIARAHGVVTTLWVRSGHDRAVLVDVVDGGGPVKIMMPIGQRVPLLAGALGRCFAGHDGFAKQELRKLFQRVRWHDAPSFEDFMDEAAEAVRRGYAIDAGHLAGGVTTISSPILDREGHPMMALSAVTFSTALDRSALAAAGRDLAQAATAATRTLAGLPHLGRPDVA